MSFYTSDPIRPWFKALENIGDCTKIRYGIMPSSSNGGGNIPDWLFKDHQKVDGIGGVVEIMREAGEHIPSCWIPSTRHKGKDRWWPFVKSIPKLIFSQRSRLEFDSPTLNRHSLSNSSHGCTSKAVSWHAFSESETCLIIKVAKKHKITVNTLLLHSLDRTIRQYLKNHQSKTSWMLPVNMRGAVEMKNETMNHSSCINVACYQSDSLVDTHSNISKLIQRQEHWQNWKGYVAGKWMSEKMKIKLLLEDKAMPQWNIGCFSNLGIWDSKKELAIRGIVFFAPPAIECQRISVGCITFQNKLSLTMQLHPALTEDQEFAEKWMNEWVAILRDFIV